MKVPNFKIILLMTWLGWIHHLTSQTNSDFLIVQLKELSNPAAISSIGNVRSTADGGYISVGTWGENIWSRALVVLLDKEMKVNRSFRMNLQLPDIFGNLRDQESYGADIVPVGGNEYVMLTAVNSNPNMIFIPGSANLDYVLTKIKIPESGLPQIMWNKRVGSDFNDVPQTLEQTHDGGFIVSGLSNAEQALNLPTIALTLLARFDANGNLKWAKRFRPNIGDCGTIGLKATSSMLRRPVIQTKDKGFVFTVHCNEYVYITKVNDAGEIIWSRYFEAGSGFFEDFPDISVAAGSIGTVIGIRELPDGKLVFLGNNWAIVMVLFGTEVNGIHLPFSHVFVTDANGNFIHGNMFSRQRYGDNSQPIEVVTQDFQVLPDNNLLIAAGNKYTCWGDDCIFVPTLITINPQATEPNAAILHTVTMPDDVIHHSLSYPYNLDFMRLMPIKPGRSDVLAFSKYLTLSNNHFEAIGNCSQTLPGWFSFSFKLDLNPTSLSAINIQELSPLPVNWGAMTVNRSTQCLISSAEPLIKSSLTTDIRITPTLTNQFFNIQVNDPSWLQATFVILDLQGRVVKSGRLNSLNQMVDVSHLPDGIYGVRVQNGQEIIILRLMVQSF